jgi:predicted GNAT family acetyltransferase
MDTSVLHDPGRSAFTVREDGVEAVLEYTRSDPAVVAFVRTFVTPALRGRGIAERLVTAGLSWARQQSLRASAKCSFVAGFLSKHPEWNDLRPGRGAS